MKLPRPISNLIDSLERLPGIGPKTAQRLTFYLLHFPQEELEKFAENLVKLKTDTKMCSICKNIGEYDPCEICSDNGRDENVIAVVSTALDVSALERARFDGRYHVLHGLIDPLNNIGPDELYIDSLVKRLREMQTDVGGSGKAQWEDYLKDDPDLDDANNSEQIEIILATNTSMEGESTAMYISKLLRDSGFGEDAVKITRIARGLPVGGDIEYADDTTLLRALEGRGDFSDQ